MKSILIIDDTESIRHFVQKALKNEGFSVTTATNGKQGLKIAEQKFFDLIITDIHMPIMGGFEFIVEVRKLEKYAFTPILILSTEHDLEQKIQGKSAGATGWIVKPIAAEQLVNTVSRVLKV